MKKSILGSVYLFFAALIWGTAFVAQSLGSEGVESFTFNGVRCLVGALVLGGTSLVLRLLGQKTPDKKEYFRILKGGVLCGLLLFGAVNFQQFAISAVDAAGNRASVGKVGFLTAMYIVMVPVIGMFRGRKTGAVIWISVAVTVVGAYLLAGAGDLGKIDLSTVLSVLASLMFALQITAVDEYAGDCDCIRLSMVQFATCGVVSLACAFVFETPSLSGIMSVKWAILYSGVMSSGIAYTLQMVGQKHCPPQLASLIMSLESVFCALSGWVILGQTLSSREMLGCGLMLAAVLLTQLGGNNEEKKA